VGIYEPQPKLSSTERALLLLLAQLVTGTAKTQTNLPPDTTVLSEREANMLLSLLEEFSSSKKFIESAYFIERITQRDLRDDSDVREIYLSWRKFYGRSRAMASTHWRDFLVRLGRDRGPHGYLSGESRSPYEMRYSHFREMERLLLARSGVGDRVSAIVLSVVDKFETEVESARHGELQLERGSISKMPAIIMETIIFGMRCKVGSPILSSSQAAGLMTVLTDVSVLFTTRDWGVAGTISTIAGGLSATTYVEK
jgi:hypothetical protein